MIWGDKKIMEWAILNCTPYSLDNVNPASINLTLGDTYRIATPSGWSKYFEIPQGGLRFRSGDFILAHTKETIEIPENATGILFLRSTAGRNGEPFLRSRGGSPGS